MYANTIAFLLALPLAAFASTAQTDTSNAVQAVTSTLNRESNGNGFSHLADDGVLRTYSSNGTVIDARPLTNAQIMTFISFVNTTASPDRVAHYLDVWTGVDGTKVGTDELLNPPAAIRPASTNFKQAAEEYQNMTSARASSKVETIGRRQVFCAGMPCSTDMACEFMGCGGCMMLDADTMAPSGVCSPGLNVGF